MWLEPRGRNLLLGFPELSDTEGLRGPKPIFSLPRETLFPNYPQTEAEANGLLLPTSSPPAERHVCPGWGGAVYETLAPRLWLYWSLIKQLPFEAHKEADDWLRRESSCLSGSVSFLALAPLPLLSIKESPTCSGNWLGKGNKLSVRGLQGTGSRATEGKGLCVGFRKSLRSVLRQSQSPARYLQGPAPVMSPFQP